MATPKKVISGLSNTKTRTFVILFGAIVVIGVGIAYLNKSDDSSDVLSQQGSQATSVPTKIKATPGSTVSPQYRELQIAENERRAQQASKTQTSAIPTILGATADPSLSKGGTTGELNANLQGSEVNNNTKQQFGDSNGTDFLGNSGPFQKTAAQRERERQEALVRQERDRIEKIRQDKERALQQQQALEQQQRVAEQEQKVYQESVQRISSQMKQYAGKTYDEWVKYPKQQYVQGALASKPYQKNTPDAVNQHGDPVANSYNGKGSATGIGSNASKTAAKKANPKLVIKAGTILFGIIETSVNTDEPGPVLASVVSGRFSGARLIGSLKHEAQQESVTITFNQMSIPKRTKSIGVSVVAIDPDTARTALASDVNRHLIFRYGTLFASSFIQGYGQAVQQQGSTTTTSPLTGATTTTYPTLDNRQIFLSALGQVGQAWASATKQYFNIPYTVTVDQGTSVGLLFMADTDLNDTE